MSRYINLFVQSDEANYRNNLNSSLTVNYNPAIRLPDKEGKKWYCKCISASIPYVSPNLYTNHYNVLKYKYNNVLHTVTIQDGLYDISNLQIKMDFLIKSQTGLVTQLFTLMPESSTGSIFIKANMTNFSILFDNDSGSNVMQMLGFPSSIPEWHPSYITEMIQGTSDTYIDQLQVINLHCNFVSSSYQTASGSNVLCSIHPDVSAFSRIQYNPPIATICEVDTYYIQQAQIELRDQNGTLINMLNEPWACSIQLFQE
jgi:hypothetical protein